MVVLQAGHRSVFKEGYYSTGGGSAKTSSKKRARVGNPKDDLGKANYQIDRILDNHLISGMTRETRYRDQRVFRNFLMDVTKAVADEMIDMGKESHAFDEIDQRILEKNSITGEELDQLVAKIDFDKMFADIDQIILKSFIRHSEEQGKRHKLNVKVLSDFMQIIKSEFVKRGGWGQKLPSPKSGRSPSLTLGCLKRLTSLLSSR